MDLTVLLEVRPLVQACWAYLIAPSLQAVAKLAVRPSDLTVTWNEGSQYILSQTVSLSPSVPINFEPFQVSSLVQEENYLSFRVQTSPRDLTGSFAVQFIQSEVNSSKCSDEMPTIPHEEPCSLVCACCSQNILLKQTIVFKRVLPLPSGAYDASDFFCHNHGDSSVANINPNEDDCLYSNTGFQIHSSHVKWKEDVVRCKSCLAWIGTTCHSRTNLWHATVDVRPISDLGDQIIKLNPAQEFVLVISKAIEQCPTLACRVLLNVKVASCVSHYLLLHVIDRQLTLLSASSSLSKDLVNHQAIKVSFHVEKDCNEMVSTWLNDCLVSCIEVALPVFVEGLKLLSKTSKFIPPSHRKAQHGFLLAYVCSDFI